MDFSWAICGPFNSRLSDFSTVSDVRGCHGDGQLLILVHDQGQANGIWTYQWLKFEIWLYHEGPTLQSRMTQKRLELSLSFFHIMKIWDICSHLQLV